jgi:hypothetical protein
MIPVKNPITIPAAIAAIPHLTDAQVRDRVMGSAYCCRRRPAGERQRGEDAMTKAQLADDLLVVANAWNACELVRWGYPQRVYNLAERVAGAFLKSMGQHKMEEQSERDEIVGAIYSEVAALGFDIEDVT